MTTPPNTESADPRMEDLDAWPSTAVLDALWEGQMAAVAAVRPALGSIAAAAEAACLRLRRGGTLAYVGAGTSGRIGVQDGSELPPTFDWPAERLRLLIAGGPAAMTQAIEGAEDQEPAGQADVAGLGPCDVLVGLAASGATPYTVAALRAARAAGALTVGVASSPGPLLAAAEVPILVQTGPEAIAGSTRMKAGTAQKVVLNLFSTLVMVRLGRVWRGRMVDMQARNAKLRRRGLSMLRELTGCDAASAQAALAAADGKVKLAVLLVRGLSPDDAQARLDAAGGNLRQA